MAELPLDAIESFARHRGSQDECKSMMAKLAEQAKNAEGGMVVHYQAQYDTWARVLDELTTAGKGQKQRRGNAMSRPVGDPKNRKKKPVKK